MFRRRSLIVKTIRINIDNDRKNSLVTHSLDYLKRTGLKLEKGIVCFVKDYGVFVIGDGIHDISYLLSQSTSIVSDKLIETNLFIDKPNSWSHNDLMINGQSEGCITFSYHGSFIRYYDVPFDNKPTVLVHSSKYWGVSRFDDKGSFDPFYLVEASNGDLTIACSVYKSDDSILETNSVAPTTVDELYLISYLISRCHSIEDVKNCMENINVNIRFRLGGFRTHYHLISSSEVCMEFTDDGIKYTDADIVTNFKLSGVNILENGKVPEVGEFSESDGFYRFSSGLERFNLVKDMINNKSLDLRALLYTNLYNSPLTLYSELLGDYGTFSLDIYSEKSDPNFNIVHGIAVQKFNSNDSSIWHTKHILIINKYGAWLFCAEHLSQPYLIYLNPIYSMSEGDNSVDDLLDNIGVRLLDLEEAKNQIAANINSLNTTADDLSENVATLISFKNQIAVNINSLNTTTDDLSENVATLMSDLSQINSSIGDVESILDSLNG